MFGAIEGEEAVGFPMPGSESNVDVSCVYCCNEFNNLCLCVCVSFCLVTQHTRKCSIIFAVHPVSHREFEKVGEKCSKAHEMV